MIYFGNGKGTKVCEHDEFILKVDLKITEIIFQFTTLKLGWVKTIKQRFICQRHVCFLKSSLIDYKNKTKTY